MGSVKDLIRDDSKAGKLYTPPSVADFGLGAWRVSGRFSVGDLKEQIPECDIANKAEALTMMTAKFFEWLANTHPEIPTCYMGLLDKDGERVDVETLIQRGDTSNIIVMKLAHVPESYCGGDLYVYRKAIASGELLCGVADVESIFRCGFPLGSSTFEKITEAVGMKDEYEKAATYDETVALLDRIRAARAAARANGGTNKKLEGILKRYGLGDTIPNPGFVLKEPVYDSTTKFESAGDRVIVEEEEEIYSGLDKLGYETWTRVMFPRLAQAQVEFCSERNLANMDGKGECVAYRRRPVVTDFACTVDENRLMIVTNVDDIEWAIPSNKEIQRAIFRQAGVYAAISEAKKRAKQDGDVDKWKGYIPQVTQERGIDLIAVTEHSCNLMAYAVAEVGNRILGQRVFDAKPLDLWVREFLPYASKIERQE